MKFTVEIKDAEPIENSQVEIYLNKEALRDLVTQLEFLKNTGDHAHFFTKEWGGLPLSSEKLGEKENFLVNHLRIILID